MTPILSSRRLRWAVPALTAAAVAAAAITLNSAGASGQPNLPPKTAAQLLAAVEQVHTTNVSGTIVETAKLGLPSIPGGDIAGSGLTLQALLAGSHTMRVWYGGPTQQRVAVLAQMAERDIIHNGKDLWTFDSVTNEVTHARVGNLPMGDEHKSDVTPQRAAELALQAIDPSTRVVVDRTARVAGRAAYQLDLMPRDARSLIGSVRIAIDAATSMPLQVQIFAAGAAKPAIQVGFTDISFSAPNQSVFHFVPPAGAKVTQQQSSSADVPDASEPGSTPHADAATGPTTLGTGWTTVVKIPAGGQLTGSNAELLQRLSTPVTGGRLVKTSLLSVLIANDGFIYAGPLSPAALQQVAATGHGL